MTPNSEGEPLPNPYHEGLRYPNRMGRLLRARREELGLTQAEIGRAINRSQHAVSRLESHGADAPPPPAEVLNPWAKALSMPVAELLRAAGYALDEDDIPTAGQMNEALLLEMVNRAAGLTPASRQALRSAIQLLYRTAEDPAPGEPAPGEASR